MALLLLLLLAAPDAKTHELKYRFEKDTSYTDEQSREWWLESWGGGRAFRWKYLYPVKVKRTILEVDDTAHPTMERVEVLQFERTVVESATPGETEEKEGTTKAAIAVGRTFVWRKTKGRWGLFGGEGEETDKHEQLVTLLSNQRDSLLPKKAVAVGDGWEVPASTFLETAGQPVPEGVQGKSRFVLEKMEEGLATITFEFTCTYRDKDHRIKGSYTGTWIFDAKKGRDQSIEAKGEIDIDEGKSGGGGVTIKRTFTWAPG